MPLITMEGYMLPNRCEAYILFTHLNKNVMTTFETIFWWYGVILGSIATVCFYGLLLWMFFQYLKDKFKK
jgi:hypothetical protein